MPWAMHLDFTPGGYCSGFMLTEHWIVTAGHCVAGRTTADDMVTVSYMEAGSRGRLRRRVSDLLPAPRLLDVQRRERHRAHQAPRQPRRTRVASAPVRRRAHAAPVRGRGHTDFAYIAGWRAQSDPGGEVEGCADPDVVSGVRRLGVLGLTETSSPPPARHWPSWRTRRSARRAMATPAARGRSGTPSSTSSSLHAGGPDDLKRATLLHPEAGLDHRDHRRWRPADHLPVLCRRGCRPEDPQCTEGHRMLLREGTGSPTVWRAPGRPTSRRSPSATSTATARTTSSASPPTASSCRGPAAPCGAPPQPPT